MDNKTIIFIDGDDTLWDTQPLYNRAISAACEEARLKGLDVSRWDDAVREAERVLMPKYGFAKERFAAALVQGYHSLCKQQDKELSVELSSTIQTIGMQVFEESAPLLSGATETVRTLSGHLPIYLVSAGPEDIQKKRLLESGLMQFLVGYRFPAMKTAEVFGSLIRELNVEPGSCWHIGNSVTSDINPARECGLNAILVGERGWDHDKGKLLEAQTKLEIVSKLYDVISILRRDYAWAD